MGPFNDIDCAAEIEHVAKEEIRKFKVSDIMLTHGTSNKVLMIPSRLAWSQRFA